MPAIDDVKKSRYGTASSPGFVRLCTELAGAGKSNRGSVDHNGTIIEQEHILEQEQILTSHIPGTAGAGLKRFFGWTTGKHWLLT